MKTQRLEPDQIVEIGRQIASGLHAIHTVEDGAADEKLVHRDLKPSNVFLTRDGLGG
jgi:serine/threonine protein kinase